MKCKGCDRDITRVIVISPCWQYGSLNGSRIVDYESVEEVLPDVTGIECPKCHEDRIGEVQI